MHIAWLGKKSPFCGNVTYSREITNALLEKGEQVSFLHFAQQESNCEEWLHCQEIFLPFIYKSQVYTIPTPKSSKVLIQALEKLKPDLVHASLTLSPLDFRLPEICTELNLPLIATFHPAFDSKLRNLKSSTQFLTYQLYAPCLANYDKVVIFSQIQKDLLIKLGVPEERLAVIPNGVDVKKYSPGYSNFKAKLNAKRLFIYQGRISTEKNVEAMLKAWKHSDLGPECKLVIVGDGPSAPYLKQYYHQEQGVIWLGYVEDDQKRIEILRSADVFILPSLVEGLSLSLLEAMACGVACLATDAGADGEVIADGAGVILNTQGVTSQLKTLLPLFKEQPELSQVLGQKGRERVLQRYTLSRNVSCLQQLYKKLLPPQPRTFVSNQAS